MLVGDNLSKDILQNCKGCSEVRGINFVQLFDLITVQRKCDIILIINDVTIISISFLNRTGKIRSLMKRLYMFHIFQVLCFLNGFRYSINIISLKSKMFTNIINDQIIRKLRNQVIKKGSWKYYFVIIEIKQQKLILFKTLDQQAFSRNFSRIGLRKKVKNILRPT